MDVSKISLLGVPGKQLSLDQKNSDVPTEQLSPVQSETSQSNLTVPSKELSSNKSNLLVPSKQVLYSKKSNLGIPSKQLSPNQSNLSVASKQLYSKQSNLGVPSKQLSPNQSNLGVPSIRIQRRTSMFSSKPMSRKQENRATAGLSECTFADDPGSDTFIQRKLRVRYQNTYKLDPDVKFSASKVEVLIEQVLMDHLEDCEYNESLCRRLVRNISDKILTAVKKLGYKRYKLVCVVNIGQLNGGTIRVASRCLWQTAHDSYAEASYESRTLWSTAVVYGLCRE